jgi:hypothetical protein
MTGKEETMPEMQTMTLDEKLDIGVKVAELYNQGRDEEADKLNRTIPLAPFLAKFYKDHFGLDQLLESGFNLSEAVEEYGPSFISPNVQAVSVPPSKLSRKELEKELAAKDARIAELERQLAVKGAALP